MEYKITTSTVSGKISECKINVYNVGDLLKIDDEVLGVKYSKFGKDVMRGCYETSKYKRSKKKNEKTINKKSFNNQVSIIYYYNNEKYNVKLFHNGSFQITGVKNPDNIYNVIDSLHSKLENKNIFTDIKIKKNEKGLYTNTDDFDNINTNNNNTDESAHPHTYIYNDNGILIGACIDNIINIDTKQYICIKTPKGLGHKGETVLMQNIGSNTGNTKPKEILDTNGKLIAIQTFRKNTSKRVLNKNMVHDYYNGLVLYNGNIIGFYDYDTSIASKTFENKESSDEIRRNSIMTSGYRDITYDIDCINILCDLKREIDRDVLYNSIKNEYYGYYDPNTYAGVKFVYKVNKFRDGKCRCENACLCSNVTFMIFGSGKVIVSGFKSTGSIMMILRLFKSLIDKI